MSMKLPKRPSRAVFLSGLTSHLVRTARRVTIRLAIAVLVVQAFGCASLRPTNSGFLNDYNQLQVSKLYLNKGGGPERDLVKKADETALAGIDSFYIEPITWALDKDDRVNADPARPVNISESLRNDLAMELGMLRPVVETPGPNTARVRASVTQVAMSRPLANIVLTVVFVPFLNGGATVEAEVVGPDGRQLAAVDIASTCGPLDGWGFYTKSGHPMKSMGRIAVLLRKALTPTP